MFRKLLLASWVVSGGCLLWAVAHPVGLESQTAVGALLLGVMLAAFLLRRRGWARTVFVALSLSIVFRYIYWRTTATLPPADELLNFIPGVILYGVELFAVGIMLISLFVVADPLQRPPARVLSAGELPTVDVFVPSYNEDASLLTGTLAACAGMDYPWDKLTVYLLDDGGTDAKCESDNPVTAHAARARRAELQKLCADLGVRYLTREKNAHAKAGNLNAALPRTSGDLVAVFDADHAPTRDFLVRTVGHFADDPRLFLVQTPHFFLNPDPIERNLSLFEKMPSENEMFYGVIQRGLDKWNAAFFCGSAALLRRAALEEAGGFEGVTITEDCETALSLHGRGWNSRYVETPLIAGLQPETFSSFIGQRSRWCRGMIQILLLKNPIFRPGLSLAQRICYISSSLFWMFPIARMTFVVAPLLHIFFNMQIYRASFRDFLAYTVVYMIANLLQQSYLFGKVRWPWMSELYEYVQSVYLVGAIVSVFLNPRKPTFNVTAKGMTLDREQLSDFAKPYFLVFGLLCVAALVTGMRWWLEPASRDMLSVVGVWNGLNLVIAGAALGVVSERQERRRFQRLAIEHTGEIVLGDVRHPVLFEDISSNGARIRPLAGKLTLPRNPDEASAPKLAILCGDKEMLLPIRVRRTLQDERGAAFGVQFTDLQPAQYHGIAKLMYANSTLLQNARAGRQSSLGVGRGTLRLVFMSVFQSMRGMTLGVRELVSRGQADTQPGLAAGDAAPSLASATAAGTRS